MSSTEWKCCQKKKEYLQKFQRKFNDKSSPQKWGTKILGFFFWGGGTYKKYPGQKNKLSNVSAEKFHLKHLKSGFYVRVVSKFPKTISGGYLNSVAKSRIFNWNKFFDKKFVFLIFFVEKIPWFHNGVVYITRILSDMALFIQSFVLVFNKKLVVIKGTAQFYKFLHVWYNFSFFWSQRVAIPIKESPNNEIKTRFCDLRTTVNVFVPFLFSNMMYLILQENVLFLSALRWVICCCFFLISSELTLFFTSKEALSFPKFAQINKIFKLIRSNDFLSVFNYSKFTLSILSTKSS